jgi:hypothetical protein
MDSLHALDVIPSEIDNMPLSILLPSYIGPTMQDPEGIQIIAGTMVRTRASSTLWNWLCLGSGLLQKESSQAVDFTPVLDVRM